MLFKHFQNLNKQILFLILFCIGNEKSIITKISSFPTQNSMDDGFVWGDLFSDY